MCIHSSISCPSSPACICTQQTPTRRPQGRVRRGRRLSLRHLRSSIACCWRVDMRQLVLLHRTIHLSVNSSRIVASSRPVTRLRLFCANAGQLDAGVLQISLTCRSKAPARSHGPRRCALRPRMLPLRLAHRRLTGLPHHRWQ